MITTIFKKSTPINYTLTVLLLLVFYFLYLFQEHKPTVSQADTLQKAAIFCLLLASLFICNFIAKKNALTKNSSYVILFFVLLLLFFPLVLKNLNLIIANFFILLAMRRLVSLQTLKAPKEKVFDASLWIFVASLFHFWAILFIVLVYVSIIFHVSRDYRNWLLPFVAFFTVAVFFVCYSLLVHQPIIARFREVTQLSFDLDYFTNIYQNLALSIFAVLAVYFVFNAIFTLTNRPLNLQASYKKMIFAFFIGIAIFVLSPEKNSDILLFTFFPISVMATNSIEYSQATMKNEIVLALSIIAAIGCFFTQL